MIYKALAALAIVGAIAAGGYFKGLSVGRVELEKAKAVWQIDFDRQVSETKRIETVNAELSRRISDELEPALATATADGASLAERLRIHASRRCGTMSTTPPSPGGPPEASGEPGDGKGTGSPVDAAVAAHLSACSRDAVRLNGWREFWKGLE